MRTPIKDLRHVSKSLPILKTLIPPESSVETFLLFSGDMEINLAEDNRFVTSHTTEIPVYDFWLTLFEEPERIVEHIKYYFPFPDDDVFQAFQKSFNTFDSPYVRAALFFLLNRCSDTGSVSHGDLDQSNFNPLCLSYIQRFKKINFDVEYDTDLLQSLGAPIESDYVFVPAGKFSYSFFQEGQNTGDEDTKFEHKELRDALYKIDKPTIVLYSYHPRVIELYKKFKTKILINGQGKITNDKDRAKEVLIANF
jgi:site-specific DNA-adenine methylase